MQAGTEEFEYLVGVAMGGDDDSIVLAGRTEGDWAASNAGGSDFSVIKLASNGTRLWSWQVRLLALVSMIAIFSSCGTKLSL